MPLNYGRGARPPVECPRRRGGGDGYSREVLKAALAHRTVEAFGKPVECEVPAWGPVLGGQTRGSAILESLTQVGTGEETTLPGRGRGTAGTRRLWEWRMPVAPRPQAD